jgi:prepilin-type N-terminal cleavage/methylation domain-containing protein
MKKRGFTLVEMTVAVAIFSLVTSVVLYNHGKFNSSVVVTNLAYQAALAVRQAQVYSLSIRADSLDGDYQNFATPVGYLGYGAHFGVGDDDDDEQNKIIYFFADKDGDLLYSNNKAEACNTGDNECREEIMLQGGNSVKEICITLNDDDEEKCGISSLDVSFQHPETNAYIIADEEADYVMSDIRSARIRLQSVHGNLRSVKVDKSGQISIVNEPTVE